MGFLFFFSFVGVVVYIGAGASVYTFAFPIVDAHGGKGDYIDGLYFSLVTLTTVGYGDYHVLAEDTGGKMVTCFFVVLGVSCVSAWVSLVLENLLHKHADAVAALFDVNG